MSRVPSHMSHSFSQVPSAQIPRSSFDRSCGYKTTFNAGYLVPVFVDEALPGDTFNMKATIFGRMNTPIKPVMDNLFMDFFLFAVPNRLVWENWEKFNGEQINPGDPTDFLVPQVVSPVGGYLPPSNWTTPTTAQLASALCDYFGWPTSVAGYSASSLWHRAYNLIWNEWFRDQNLQNSRPVPMGDGPDTYTDFTLMKRGKRHDYFTSCLPWPQKGPAVPLPLTGNAPVQGIGFIGNIASSGATPGTLRQTTPLPNSAIAFGGRSGGSSGNDIYVQSDSATPGTMKPLIYADLSAVTAATINQLRQSFQIQKLYERDARGGTRYTEIIRAHFGVISPDSRLQRPEYLGGFSSPIVVTPIAQQSATSGQPTPQGNLAAMATVSHTGPMFIKSFTEHTLIIGMVSVRADLTYQQGLNRMFSRRTRWDYYWPALSHIGEQAVLNKEIYTQGTAADANVFGYQERFAEYRYKPSQVTGRFRSNAVGGTLDMWHLAQNFSSLPTLGDTFIQDAPPMARISSVVTEPDFQIDSYFNLKCARPMPVYSVPGLIDHF